MKAFTKRRCPKCDAPGYAFRESRRTQDAIRRRLVCSSCGHRETVFEVSQSWYDEACSNARIISKLRTALGAGSPESLSETKAPEASCLMCSFMSGKGCFFGFPEAGGEFAAECSQYAPVRHG
jgi:hypothetical protein